MIQQEEILCGRISIRGEPIVAQETYSGSYNVTPKITSQILETQMKLMLQNLSVAAIPYFETSNKSGKTIIIGEI